MGNSDNARNDMNSRFMDSENPYSAPGGSENPSSQSPAQNPGQPSDSSDPNRPAEKKHNMLDKVVSSLGFLTKK